MNENCWVSDISLWHKLREALLVMLQGGGTSRSKRIEKAREYLWPLLERDFPSKHRKKVKILLGIRANGERDILGDFGKPILDQNNNPYKLFRPSKKQMDEWVDALFCLYEDLLIDREKHRPGAHISYLEE
jgi:hypothetical protein